MSKEVSQVSKEISKIREKGNRSDIEKVGASKIKDHVEMRKHITELPINSWNDNA